jgi:hypothetical protein
MSRGGVVAPFLKPPDSSMPGAKWTPLYCGGGGMARQQFRGRVRHCRRESAFEVAASLTASDSGREGFAFADAAVNAPARLVVRDGGRGSVDASGSDSSANGVGGDS